MSRLYKLWKKYKNFVFTAQPFSVWHVWVADLEKYLVHPDNLEFAQYWAGGGVVHILSFTEILLQAFDEGKEDISEVELEDLVFEARDDLDKGKEKERDPEPDEDGNDMASSLGSLQIAN